MKSYDIVAYTFNADIYCPNCVVPVLSGMDVQVGSIESALDVLASDLGINRNDEFSFDSSEFPKVIFADQLEETDWCAECHEKIL